jgi:hypothetical protein
MLLANKTVYLQYIYNYVLVFSSLTWIRILFQSFSGTEAFFSLRNFVVYFFLFFSFSSAWPIYCSIHCLLMLVHVYFAAWSVFFPLFLSRWPSWLLSLCCVPPYRTRASPCRSSPTSRPTSSRKRSGWWSSTKIVSFFLLYTFKINVTSLRTIDFSRLKPPTLRPPSPPPRKRDTVHWKFPI